VASIVWRGGEILRGGWRPLSLRTPLFLKKWQKVGQGWIPNRVGNDVLLVGNDVLLVGNDVLLVGNDGGDGGLAPVLASYSLFVRIGEVGGARNICSHLRRPRSKCKYC
jgi:hypothetical protein